VGARAGSPEREEEFRRAIFRAYFVHDRNIADPDVLVEAATWVGSAPADEAGRVDGTSGPDGPDGPDGHSAVLAYTGEQLGDLRTALVERRYRAAVQQQYQEARELGVTAVPTFIAGGYALVGAHPYDHFQRLMEASGQPPRAPAAAG